METAGEGVGLVRHDADPVVFLRLGGHCGGVDFGEGAGEEAEEVGFYEHWRGRGVLVFWWWYGVGGLLGFGYMRGCRGVGDYLGVFTIHELEEGGQKSDVCTRLIYGNAALITILYVSRNGPLGFVNSGGISTHQHPLGTCSYS